jgi:8-oxo-dGTP pyrophosphatase MutT (NUDIX family)
MLITPDWGICAVSVRGIYCGPTVWRNRFASKTGRAQIPRRLKRKTSPAVRVQYGALPYRFTKDSGLEILLVTTRQTRRWIIPKGWPIKGLRPPKSAAREAFEEAGVRGKVGTKSLGFFTYEKFLDGNGVRVACEVKVFPLLVTRQSELWPELDQRMAQWLAPTDALSLIEQPELKALVAAFAKRKSVARRPLAFERGESRSKKVSKKAMPARLPAAQNPP